jgi:cell division protein FtsW
MKAARKQPADFWFFAATVILVVVGVLLVFDASYARAADKAVDNPWFFVKKQIMFAIAGFLALLVAMKIRPKKLRKATKIVLSLSIILLGLVMVPGIGKSIGGAARWIPIGPFHLQPSELAKLAVVMYLADRFAAKGLRIRRFGTLIPHLLVVGVIAGLVLIEPDMGTTAAIIFTTGAMIYVAGVKKRHIFAIALTGLLLTCLLIAIEPYRLERVTNFLNPGHDYYGGGYQITHSLIAQATGGIAGQGICEGREKYYIPAPETDMIAATLAEEAGFIGMVILLSLFVVFTYRGLSIGHRAKSSYSSLLAIGFTSLIGIQALVNIAVLTASVPATGVPLPFISYGGSYLIVMLFGSGVVLSVSRHIDDEIKEPELEKYESSHHGRRDRRSHISCTEYRPAAKRARSRTPIRR